MPKQPAVNLQSPGAIMLMGHLEKCLPCRAVFRKKVAKPNFDDLCAAGQILVIATLRSRARRATRLHIIDEMTHWPYTAPRSAYTGGRVDPFRAISRSLLNHIYGKFGSSSGGSMAAIPMKYIPQQRRAPRFYVASSFKNMAHVQALSAALVAAGWEQTYDWTHAGGPAAFDKRAEVSLAEVEAVKAADVVIMLAPGGRGTHIELGVAIALGKPIFLAAKSEKDLDGSDGKPCAFYSHPLIRRVADKRWWATTHKGRVNRWASLVKLVTGSP